MGKKKSGKNRGVKMSMMEFTQKLGYKQESLLPTGPEPKDPTENENKDAYLEKSNWRGSRVSEQSEGDNDSMQLSAADTDTNWRRKKPPLHTNQTESLNNFNRGSFGQRNSSDQRNGSDQRTRFGNQRNDSEQRTRFGNQRNDSEQRNGSEQRTRFGNQQNDSEQRNGSEQRTRFGNQRNGSDQRTSFGNQRNGFGNQLNNERPVHEYKGKYTSNNKTDNGFIPRWRRKQVKEEEENKPKTILEILTNDLKEENKPRRRRKKKKKKNAFVEVFIPMSKEEKKNVMDRIQQMNDEESDSEEVDSNGEPIEKEDLDEIPNFELNYINNPDSKEYYRNGRVISKW